MLSKNTFHHSNKFFLRTNYLFASFVWLTSTIEGFQPFWFSQKLATIIFMDFVGVRQQINHDFFFLICWYFLIRISLVTINLTVVAILHWFFYIVLYFKNGSKSEQSVLRPTKSNVSRQTFSFPIMNESKSTKKKLLFITFLECADG